MYRCEKCGAQWSDNARFCSSCGHKRSLGTDIPPGTSDVPQGTGLSPDALTALSGTPSPFPMRGEQDAPTVLSGQDTEANRFPPSENIEGLPTGSLSEEEERRRRIQLGLPLLGSLAAGGQPPTAGVPMVHGTPQISGVPMVQGTPHPASLHHPSGPHLGQHNRSSTPHRPGNRSAGNLHKATHRASALTSVGKAVVTIIVIVVGGFGVMLAGSATLALTNSTPVVSGGVLPLHGSHFLLGGSVTLTRDAGLPVNVPVTVSPLGTFDVTVPVSLNWSLGLHTIHATETLGSRNAALQFTVNPALKITVNGGVNCPQNGPGGNFICNQTLELAPGFQGSLHWSASSDIAGVTFSPPSGTLSLGQSQHVIITIPGSQCPVSGHFFYLEQGGVTIPVMYRCSRGGL